MAAGLDLGNWYWVFQVKKLSLIVDPLTHNQRPDPLPWPTTTCNGQYN